jgi:hypothetical protein
MDSYELISVKLSEICGYHPDISKFVAQMADQQFTASIVSLSEQVAERFLKLHPICITKCRGKFFVVAGFRSFQIAELKLQQAHQIECLLINSKHNNIIDLAKTDILFSPLVFSLSTKVAQQTQKLIEIVGKDFTNEHHSDLCSVRSLTRVHERS